jgi:hypothetical protein
MKSFIFEREKRKEKREIKDESVEETKRMYLFEEFHFL